MTRPQTEQRENAALRDLPRPGSDSNDWWYSKLPKKTIDTHPNRRRGCYAPFVRIPFPRTSMTRLRFLATTSFVLGARQFVLGARQCPSCRRSSHLACACRNCKLDWQLNGWLCSHFAEHGRCDHTGAEQCTFDCANQDVVRLCPELEAQFRAVQRSCT